MVIDPILHAMFLLQSIFAALVIVDSDDDGDDTESEAIVFSIGKTF